MKKKTLKEFISKNSEKILFADIETNEFLKSKIECNDIIEEIIDLESKNVTDLEELKRLKKRLKELHEIVDEKLEHKKDELKVILIKIIDNNDRINTFYDVDSFMLWLYKRCNRNKTALIVYFHNLAFDSKFFLDLLNRYYPKCPFIIKNDGSTLSIKCYLKFGNKYELKLEFRDSLALLVNSVLKLSYFSPFAKVSLENLELRCENDIKIVKYSFNLLFDFISKFFPKFTLSRLPLTIATLSLLLFEHKLPEDMKVYTVQYEKSYRMYYFGGRVECFDFNGCFAYYNDINSSYPNVMQKYDFPLPPYERSVIPLKGKEFFGCICRVKELTDLPFFPERIDGLSVVYGKTTKIVFMFREEMEYVIQNNLVEIERIYYYLYADRNEFIFKEMILQLWKLRQEFGKEHGFNWTAKIIMNSCYGKFAQRNERQENVLIIPELMDEFKDKKFEIELDEENIMLYASKKRVVRDKYRKINIIIAMRVTALARLELYKSMKLAFDMKCLIYIDTDSIVTSIDMFPESDKLGDLKIEKSGFFQAFSQKEYVFYTDKEKKIKMKGFTDVKSIKDVYFGGVSQYRVLKFKSALRRKIRLNINENYVKRKSTFYYKRKIREDLTTVPVDDDEMLNLDIIQNHNKKYVLELAKQH